MGAPRRLKYQQLIKVEFTLSDHIDLCKKVITFNNLRYIAKGNINDFFQNLLRPSLGILYLIIVSSSNTVAEQPPSSRKDSTENTVNAPEHLQRVLLDSID
jgi:hypothetical protein